ncbi:MAG: histidine kinase [Candidatus Izemoplasmatales bacterium]
MKRSLGLREKILFALVGILLVSTLLMLFVIRGISRNKIENESREDIIERQVQFDQAFLNIINRITYTNLYLFDNSQDLYDVLESDQAVETKQSFIDNLIVQAALDDETFGEIGVYYNYDIFSKALIDQRIDKPSIVKLESILSLNEGLYFVETVDDISGNTYFIFARHIATMYPSREIFGLGLFYLEETLVKDALTLLTSELSADEAYSFVYLNEVNNPDRIIYSLMNNTYFDNQIYEDFNDSNLIISEVNDQRIIMIKSELTKTNQAYSNLDFSLVTVLDYNVLFADFLQLNQYILLVGLLSVVFLLFIATRTSEIITKPVKKLIDDLRSFQKGKKKEGLSTLNEKDEIYELEVTYNQMIEEIIRLIDENNTEMENKRKLELYALQMQINPHFLYNTLDTIAWLAKLKNEKDIENLVLSLAKFFRLSLHKGDKFIKIKEEVDLVKSFLEIEKIRFPELFDVEYEIADEVKEIETLKLIFQPIVENAIKHGFSDIDYRGKITIRAELKENDIFFEIEDNGKGFDADEDLFADDKLLTGLGGYGLKNVDERIKLEYGRDYGVSVLSVVGTGTKVQIRIKRTHN